MGLANTVTEQQMLIVVALVHRVQRNLLHTVTEHFAEPTRYRRLQLLKISDNAYEGGVRLLLDTLEQALPPSILILTGLVTEDEVATLER